MRRPPTRSCVACRTARPKQALIRVVRTPDRQIHLDPGGRANGRGAYVCASERCIDDAISRGALTRALGTPMPAELGTMLRGAAATIDDEGGSSGKE